MQCPVCDSPNADSASECGRCGKVFLAGADDAAEIPPIEGLEETLHDPWESEVGKVPALPDLERTQLARRDLDVTPEEVPGVEPTQIEADPGAASFWSGATDPDLESGREPDDGRRTAAPEDQGICPWCDAPAASAICDNCGRRRSRYTAPAAAAQATARNDDTVLCPACFGRVPTGLRCTECGVPFAVIEL